ncbi:hypothetical protein ACJX0J_020883, partial [Zea mays]
LDGYRAEEIVPGYREFCHVSDPFLNGTCKPLNFPIVGGTWWTDLKSNLYIQGTTPNAVREENLCLKEYGR